MITAKEARENSIENSKRSMELSELNWKWEGIKEQIRDAISLGLFSIEISEDTEAPILDLLNDLGFKDSHDEYSGLITISW